MSPIQGSLPPLTNQPIQPQSFDLEVTKKNLSISNDIHLKNCALNAVQICCNALSFRNPGPLSAQQCPSWWLGTNSGKAADGGSRRYCVSLPAVLLYCTTVLLYYSG